MRAKKMYLYCDIEHHTMSQRKKIPVQRRKGSAPPQPMWRVKVDENNSLQKIRERINRPAINAYCVKCRSKQPMAEPQLTRSAGGRKMLKGKCAQCGGKTNLFVSESFKL